MGKAAFTAAMSCIIWAKGIGSMPGGASVAMGAVNLSTSSEAKPAQSWRMVCTWAGCLGITPPHSS